MGSVALAFARVADASGYRPVNHMKVLDLYCGVGGAAVGYADAGFDVIGVDIVDQPRYPFEFIRADAIDVLERFGGDFDVIHASPPCQAYSRAVRSTDSQWTPTRGRNEPRLIAATRDAMPPGKPYVIENVVSRATAAELHDPILLCGSMFGLHIPRHRYFESNVPLDAPPHPSCRGMAKRAAAELGFDVRDMTVTGKGRRSGTSDRWRLLLGIEHPALQRELSEAIPPAFTKYIGEQITCYS